MILFIAVCLLSISRAYSSLVRTFSGHTDRVTLFAIYKNDLFSVSHDAVAIRWNISSGNEVQRYTHYSERVRTVAIHDGDLFLASGKAFPTRVDIDTGEIKLTYTGNTSGSVFLFHKQSMIVNDRNGLHRYDVDSGEYMFSYLPDFYLSTGREMIQDGLIYLVDPSSENEIVEFSYETNAILATLYVGVSPISALFVDDHFLSASLSDGTVVIWNRRTKQEQHSISASVAGPHFIFGSKIYLGDRQKGTYKIQKYDYRTGELAGELSGHNGPVSFVKPYGRWLVSCSHDATLKLWDFIECESGFEWAVDGKKCQPIEGYTHVPSMVRTADEISETEDSFTVVPGGTSSLEIASDSNIVFIPAETTILVVSIVVIGVVLGGISVFLLLKKSGSQPVLTVTRKIADSTNEEGISDTETTLEKSIVNSIQTDARDLSVGSTGLTTVSPEDQGISIPGYLSVKGTDYRTEKKIGKGGTSDIYLGKCFTKHAANSDDDVIIKFLHSSTSLEHFEQEVALMALFKGSPHIVQLLAYDSECKVIIMKLCRFGNLDSWCVNEKFTSLRTLRLHLSFMLDIARGLREIHGRFLIHGDMKSPNVLVDVNRRDTLCCVITDFGATQVRRDFEMKVKQFQPVNINAISVRFAAPEIIVPFHKNEKLPREPEVDIYSYGVIMYNALTCKRPFEHEK